MTRAREGGQRSRLRDVKEGNERRKEETLMSTATQRKRAESKGEVGRENAKILTFNRRKLKSLRHKSAPFY